MRGKGTRWLTATALAAALLVSGCDIVGTPIPVKPPENVGADPTGENIDTSTLPPDREAWREPVAVAPSAQQRDPSPPRTAPPVRTPSQPVAPLTKTYVAPSDLASPRVGPSGMVHHSRVHHSRRRH